MASQPPPGLTAATNRDHSGQAYLKESELEETALGHEDTPSRVGTGIQDPSTRVPCTRTRVMDRGDNQQKKLTLS